MATLTCSDPRHSLRSALPGWQTNLGTCTVDTAWAICSACATAREAEAVEDPNDPDNSASFYEGGVVIFERVLRYMGKVLRTKRRRANVSALSLAQKTALAGIKTTLLATSEPVD